MKTNVDIYFSDTWMTSAVIRLNEENRQQVYNFLISNKSYISGISNFILDAKSISMTVPIFRFSTFRKKLTSQTFKSLYIKTGKPSVNYRYNYFNEFGSFKLVYTIEVEL